MGNASQTVPASEAIAPPEVRQPPKERKLPKQRRSRHLVAAIKEAYERIATTEGPDALTPTRVTEVAGIEFGSFYQYFPNIDALSAAYFKDRILDHLFVTSGELEALRHASLQDALRHTIKRVLDFYRRMAALNHKFLCTYPEFFNLSHYFNRLTGKPDAAVATFKSFLERDPMIARGGKNTESLAFMINECVGAIALHAALRRDACLDDPDLPDRILRMCMSLVEPAAQD